MSQLVAQLDYFVKQGWWWLPWYSSHLAWGQALPYISCGLAPMHLHHFRFWKNGLVPRIFHSIDLFQSLWQPVLGNFASYLFPSSAVLAEPGLTPAVVIINTMITCNHTTASNIIKLSLQMWKYQGTVLCTQNPRKKSDSELSPQKEQSKYGLIRPYFLL